MSSAVSIRGAGISYRRPVTVTILIMTALGSM